MDDLAFDPLADGMQWVTDMYQLLKDAYLSRFGAGTDPRLIGWHVYAPPSNECPQLLPYSDEWVCIPPYDYPARLSDERIEPPEFPDDADHTVLLEWQEDILERAAEAGLKHRTLGILDTAISKAEEDVQEHASIRFETCPELKTVGHFRFRVGRYPSTPGDMQRLFRLRLEWLRQWRQVTEKRLKSLKAQDVERVNVASENYERFIKPAAIDAVYFVLDDFVLKAVIDQEEAWSLTGQWYAHMLWLIGMPLTDLKGCDWTRIVKKKHRNFQNYDQHQLELETRRRV